MVDKQGRLQGVVLLNDLIAVIRRVQGEAREHYEQMRESA